MKDRIIQLRERLGLSQADFARAIGVAPGYLALVEADRRKLSEEHLQEICDRYQVSRAWLEHGEGELGEDFNQPRILVLRKKLGLSRKAFADYIGRSLAIISKMETRKAGVTDQMMDLVCDKFHVRRDWLANGRMPMFREGYTLDSVKEEIAPFFEESGAQKAPETEEPVQEIESPKEMPETDSGASALEDPVLREREMQSRMDAVESEAEKIAEIRQVLKVSQRQLGEMLGMSGNMISMMEHGQRKVPDPVIQRLEDMFHVSFEKTERAEGVEPAEATGQEMTEQQVFEAKPDAPEEIPALPEEEPAVTGVSPAATEEVPTQQHTGKAEDMASEEVPAKATAPRSGEEKSIRAAGVDTGDAGVVRGILQAVRILSRHMRGEELDAALCEIQDAL